MDEQSPCLRERSAQLQLETELEKPDVNEDGRIYTWEGFTSAKPLLLKCPLPCVGVKTVSLGGSHGALVTVDGQLLMFGSNDHGQVGVSSDSTTLTVPALLNLPTDEWVVDVSCGRSHTVCASASGHVFCWGDNTHSQCGVIGPQTVVSPLYIPVVIHVDGNLKHRLSESNESTNEFPGDRDSSHRDSSAESDFSGRMCSRRDCCHSHACHMSQSGCSGLVVNAKMVQVSCGWTHTAALSNCGKLWAWGAGIQVGVADCLSVPVPYPVEFPANRQVISVSCGGQHTVALTVREVTKTETPAVAATAKTGVSRTVSCTLGAGQNTSELIKLTDVPPEAKKGLARRSASNQQKSDSDIGTEKNCPIFETASNATDMNIPMHSLASPSSRESAMDDVETDSVDTDYVAEYLLASTCIDDVCYVETTTNCDLSANTSENSVSTAQETVDQLYADSNTQSVEIRKLSTSCDSVPKSRSSFLDETEAIMFLEKQMSDTSGSMATAETRSSEDRNLTKVEKKNAQDVAASSSPFAKTVESLLQHVPSSPVVQEYVSNLTRTVVSNLRTSVDRRLNYVTSQVELSVRTIASVNQVADSGETEVNTALDDSALLDRLALSNCESGDIALVKSSSMGLESSRMTHHRNASLPGRTLDNAALAQMGTRQYRKIHVDTEVWSWGSGDRGQLGHADLLDRCTPCRLTSLDRCQTVKVVAGGQHTVALSAACQVYAWGCNSDGQLGHCHRGTTTPRLISVHGHLPCWDIAAGDDHTVILCDDGLTNEPNIYYCGKDKQESSLAQLSRFGKLHTSGLVCRVFAGGDGRVACVTGDGSSLMSAVYQLAASERLFFMNLDKIEQLFIQPLLQLEMAAETTDSLDDAQSIADKLTSIARLSAEYHLRLSAILYNGSSSSIAGTLFACLTRDMDERLWVYESYATCFTNALVCGTFDKLVKTNKSFFDKIKLEFADILEANKVDMNNVSLTFQRVLQFPLRRTLEYQKLLAAIADLYPAYTQEYARLSRLSQSWQSMKQKINVGQELAEKTLAYWQTAPLRVLETLQTSDRRLVRDSRKQPLLLSSAGRFSSTHTFLLFNDCFVHLQYSGHQICPLSTVWVELLADTKHLKNAIQLVMPEDTLTLTVPTHSAKAEWVWCLNQTISRCLLDEKKSCQSQPLGGSLVLLPPPRDRHAAFTFRKAGPLKDAQYKGMWRCGKIHGHGELVWPDGRRYCGMFAVGQFEGLGIYTQPSDDLGVEISEGMWKAGQLHGQARVRRSNGDVYKGAFVDGKKHGHGVLKQGKFSASLANVYVGQWQADKRHGYGICDDIPKGQKYMGMWQDDNRHGNGVIVTVDGLYFEGNFVSGKITGQGLLITEDSCSYEGEFSGGPNLSGKGVLTLPNGDYIEGQFHGSFSDGIKVNGMFRKASIDHSTDSKLTSSISSSVFLKRYGGLCVAANEKWCELFERCYTYLLGTSSVNGQVPIPTPELSQRAWQNIAAILNNCSTSSYRPKQKKCSWNLDELQRIPDHIGQTLTLETYSAIRCYLGKAFDTSIHPLAQLLDSLVDAFLATYVGIGSHLRLLYHAVDEFKSFVTRLYLIIRLLFPTLPEASQMVHVFSEVVDAVPDGPPVLSRLDDLSCEWVTPASLLHPLLLPKIYPPLFNLYALYNEKDDDRYWKRIRLWNKQSNLALMSYLGVDRKFWLCQETSAADLLQQQDDVSESYLEAIDRLQRISTSFSPTEKLSQIQLTFDEINTVVQRRLGTEYQWSMDDLFPLFQFIVVRSCIQHLAAEIHFIDDLMEPHLQHGELGIMFTTLKACYFQILNEKVV